MNRTPILQESVYPAVHYGVRMDGLGPRKIRIPKGRRQLRWHTFFTCSLLLLVAALLFFAAAVTPLVSTHQYVVPMTVDLGADSEGNPVWEGCVAIHTPETLIVFTFHAPITNNSSFLYGFSVSELIITSNVSGDAGGSGYSTAQNASIAVVGGAALNLCVTALTNESFGVTGVYEQTWYQTW